MTTDEKILRIAFNIGTPVFFFEHPFSKAIFKFNNLDDCFNELIKMNKETGINTPFDIYFDEENE